MILQALGDINNLLVFMLEDFSFSRTGAQTFHRVERFFLQQNFSLSFFDFNDIETFYSRD
jgi:hypothetical protein